MSSEGKYLNVDYKNFFEKKFLKLIQKFIKQLQMNL